MQGKNVQTLLKSYTCTKNINVYKIKILKNPICRKFSYSTFCVSQTDTENKATKLSINKIQQM